MNYTERLLADALQSGAKSTGYNMDSALRYLKENAPDRRYRIFALAGSCSWGYNEHGSIQYRGQAYSYQQNKDGYVVTVDPSYPPELLYGAGGR